MPLGCASWDEDGDGVGLRHISPGLFARAQGRARAGGLVARSGAGLRLLDINNTQAWDGGGGEGPASLRFGSPSLQKLSLSLLFGCQTLSQLLSFCEPLLSAPMGLRFLLQCSSFPNLLPTPLHTHSLPKPLMLLTTMSKRSSGDSLSAVAFWSR